MTRRTPTTAPAPSPRDQMLYPTSLLVAVQDGAVLDQRMKFAMNLMIASTQSGVAPIDAESAVAMADSLYEQAEERGWIQPLPEHDGLTNAEQAHIKRQARAQVLNNTSLGAAAAETQARVTGAPMPGMNGMPPTRQ